MQRLFLSNIVTVDIGGETFTGPAIDILRKPDGTFFWPEGTTKRHLDYTGFDWTLSVVTHPINVPIPNDPRVDMLPDYSLDAKVSAMHAPTLSAMKQAMSKRGISTGFLDDRVDGFREVVRAIGQAINPGFNESYFGL